MNLFIPGQIYHRRTEIHKPYGGQEQGGISTPKTYKLIFLFTGETGKRYGYDENDGWHGEYFSLTAEGQEGDQQFIKGNKAVRDHIEQHKDLHLFSYDGMKKGFVRYLGQMICTGASSATAPDKNGKQRNVIVFHLTPLERFTDSGTQDNVQEISLEVLKKKAEQETNNQPRVFERTVTYRERSSAIRQYALKRSNGHCEGCKEPAPFKGTNNEAFLEVHHVLRLSDGGPDAHDAVIAICPNCHRRAHYSRDAKEFNDKLIQIVRKEEAR